MSLLEFLIGRSSQFVSFLFIYPVLYINLLVSITKIVHKSSVLIIVLNLLVYVDDEERC
jgi:hypothetical protein